MSVNNPVSAEAWAAGRTLGDPQLSPAGDHIAFVTTSGDRSELAVVELKSRVEQWLPCEPAVKRASSSTGGMIGWLPDGRGLVYVGVDGCLHRIDRETFTCRALTTWPSSISSISVSPDGTRVAYVNDTRDVAVASTEGSGVWPVRVSADADFVFDPVWSPDSSLLAWHEWDDPHMAWDDSRIVVRRSDGSGPVRTVAGREPGENDPGTGVQQPRFSPDGSQLAFLSDADGWLNIWATETESFDNAKPLLNEPYEHGLPSWGPGQRSYAWTADGRAIVYARNEGGWGRLARVDLDNCRVDIIDDRAFNALTASSLHVAGIATGPDAAITIDVVGVREHERATIARGPVMGVERAGVEPELVNWQRADGTTIHGRLYRTTNDAHGTPPPLLVWIHGGPTGQSMATLYARISYFVERGWSVLVPDYRGSTGWGREYLQALNGQWGVLDVADVAAGMQAAEVNGWGHPGKLVPYGGSAGGFTALLLLQQHPELCAAGVTMYPVCDLADFGASTWRFEAHYLDTLVGELPDSYDTYVQRSPITHADKIQAPVLILHGDADNVVPVEQSATIAERIDRAGGQVSRHVYEGEGHGWRKSATISDELERVQSFLLRNVLHINATTEENS